MHSHEDKNRSRTALTTEDLVRPTGTEEMPGEAKKASTRPPVFPGEAARSAEKERRGGSPATGAPEGEAATSAPGTSDATAGSDAPGTSDMTGARDATGTSDAPGSERQRGAGSESGTAEDEAPQLLTDDEGRAFRDRWQEIQSKFVDDPRDAVHDADALVAEVMQTLAATFSQHKKDLEGQWGEGEQVSTEELRGALRRYRSFFRRLLTT
ncbi:hypothetical protein ACFV0T_24680 [Streptomyces sp. NPDC059582]|uniref:hypothetical protein n=1 Tax=Streptomyces sp. NPDC059582 TaxID=3346875 RepID=UPI0036A49131